MQRVLLRDVRLMPLPCLTAVDEVLKLITTEGERYSCHDILDALSTAEPFMDAHEMAAERTVLQH